MNSDKTATIRMDARLVSKVKRLAKLRGMTVKGFMELAAKVTCVSIERDEQAIPSTHAQKWLAKRKEVPHEGSLGIKQKGRSLTK